MIGQTTLSVKPRFAFGATPLFAVTVKAYGEAPCDPAAGVPATVAVPLPLFVNVTPVGRAPIAVRDIEAPVGKPVVVTRMLDIGMPGGTVKVLVRFVIAGAWFTVSVKVWLASGRMPDRKSVG